MVWVFIRRQLCSFDGGLCVTKIHRKYSKEKGSVKALLFFRSITFGLMRFSMCLVRAFSLLGTLLVLVLLRIHVFDETFTDSFLKNGTVH